MSESTKTCGCGPTCCSDGNASKVIDAVREQYGATARSALTNDVAGVQAVAEAFGYTAEELSSIPSEANMGLSCGNPIASAHLKPGEVVVDLGSGGGLDVFLAAQKVGPTGRAIGIDMTPDMIARASRAAAEGVDGTPIANVEFHHGRIDRLPLADGSADVIISNCVINLVPDKQAVFREMFRVLKPGGRVAVSDIALKQPLPAELANDLMAYVGCVAGAIEIGEYQAGLRSAGFAEVAVVDAKADLNAYNQVQGQSLCCSAGEGATSSTCSGGSIGHSAKASIHAHLRDLTTRYNVNDYAASVKVFAIKRG